MNKKKKVLRIETGKFLKVLYDNRAETCDHIKDAMDVGELDFRTLENALHHLYNMGFKNMKVLEID